MKKYILLLLFAFTCTVMFGQSADPVIRDLSQKKFQWMVSGRLDSLAAMLDERLVFIHSNGLMQDKTAVIDDIKNKKLVFHSIVAHPLEVRLYEDSAILTGRGKFEGINDQKPFSVELLYTEVYVKSKGRWFLASRHANKIQ